MTGYPSLAFALLQGLLTAVLMITPVLVFVFAGRLRVTGGDLLLALATYPMCVFGTMLVFLPFEAGWADMALGPLAALRPVLVGALAVTLGMVVTQWKLLSRRGPAESLSRLGGAFLAGALWGGVWQLAGWCVANIGVLGDG